MFFFRGRQKWRHALLERVGCHGVCDDNLTIFKFGTEGHKTAYMCDVIDGKTSVMPQETKYYKLFTFCHIYKSKKSELGN